jgi:methionyl-tRNA formyltransferase
MKSSPRIDIPEAGTTFSAGTVVSLERGVGFVVKSGHDFLLIHTVQPEGKRPMSAWDYWQGARIKLGEKLG